MFTGIIEELGKIRQITTNMIQVECNSVLEGIHCGDSVAVNGVCLTVTDIKADSFIAEISPETMKVTTFGNLQNGNVVNLERAMKADGRFGGHIVSGHIDGRGRITEINKVHDFCNLEIELNNECAGYVIKKGSISVNGISLTIAEVKGDLISISVIPHTFENTNLKTLRKGDFVNIENDIFAKYIEKFLLSGDNRSRIDYNFLNENGYF